MLLYQFSVLKGLAKFSSKKEKRWAGRLKAKVVILLAPSRFHAWRYFLLPAGYS
jgi:hypothetical protein